MDQTPHPHVPQPIARVNHACSPNLGLHCNGDGKVVLFALRDIDQDEELTRNYLWAGCDIGADFGVSFTDPILGAKRRASKVLIEPV